MSATDTESLQDSYAVESRPSYGRHILPCPCSPISHRRIDGGSTTTPTVALYHNRLTWWSPGRFGKVEYSAQCVLCPVAGGIELHIRMQDAVIVSEHCRGPEQAAFVSDTWYAALTGRGWH